MHVLSRLCMCCPVLGCAVPFLDVQSGVWMVHALRSAESLCTPVSDAMQSVQARQWVVSAGLAALAGQCWSVLVPSTGVSGSVRLARNPGCMSVKQVSTVRRRADMSRTIVLLYGWAGPPSTWPGLDHTLLDSILTSAPETEYAATRCWLGVRCLVR